jgi:hypothetical protein
MSAAGLRALLGLHAVTDQQLARVLAVAQEALQATSVKQNGADRYDPAAGSKFAWDALKHLYRGSGSSSSTPAWSLSDGDAVHAFVGVLTMAFHCFEVRTLTLKNGKGLDSCKKVPFVDGYSEPESHTVSTAQNSNQDSSCGQEPAQAPASCSARPAMPVLLTEEALRERFCSSQCSAYDEPEVRLDCYAAIGWVGSPGHARRHG